MKTYWRRYAEGQSGMYLVARQALTKPTDLPPCYYSVEYITHPNSVPLLGVSVDPLDAGGDLTEYIASKNE